MVSTPYVDDLSSVDSKGLGDKACEALVHINKQDSDIAGGVDIGKEDMKVVAGGQGIMLGYVTDRPKTACRSRTQLIQSEARRGRKFANEGSCGCCAQAEKKLRSRFNTCRRRTASLSPRKLTPL